MKPSGSIPWIDFVIINVPVWLFLCLSLLAVVFAAGFSFPVKLIPLAVAWWSFCIGLKGILLSIITLGIYYSWYRAELLSYEADCLSVGA